MRIHLVRHGETRHNAEGRIQGDVLDDGLNGVGRAQADALYQHYASERFRGLFVAAVYTSPLRRARETAERIAAALDLPEPKPLHGLRELSWGQHNGKLNTGPVRAEMERVLSSWGSGDLGAATLGGETPGQGWERAIKDVAPLIDRHANDDVIIVAHGRMNKILTSGLLHGHLHHMDRYPQANASITYLEGPHPWRVASANVTRHLGPLRALDERSN